MKVLVGKKMYRMSRTEYDGLLKVASEQVPFGIYAVVKKDYTELRCDRCNSMTQLKKLTRQFNQQGFKVLSNRGDTLKPGDTEALEEGLMSAT